MQSTYAYLNPMNLGILMTLMQLIYGYLYHRCNDLTRLLHPDADAVPNNQLNLRPFRWLPLDAACVIKHGLIDYTAC